MHGILQQPVDLWRSHTPQRKPVLRRPARTAAMRDRTSSGDPVPPSGNTPTRLREPFTAAGR